MSYLIIAFLSFLIVLIFVFSKNSKVELAFEKSPNFAILLVNKNNKIKFINKQFEKIFNIQPKSLLNKDLKDLVGKIPELSHLNELCLLKDTAKDITEKIIEKSDRYFRISFSNVLKNGVDFDGFILTIIDITYEKELENTRLKQEQMLSLNSKMATMGEMISAISHQQRSPISTAMLCLDDIDECVQNGNFDGVNLNIVRAKNSLELMNDTIKSFAKFYKKDDMFCSFDLKELIKELVFIVAPKLNEHGIKLDVSFSEDEKFIINSISGYIKQILLSLISNARDELILLSNEDCDAELCIGIKLYKTQDEICISVSDNGGGIESESEIFKPFFTTKKESGTGMGLYVADMLCKTKLGARLALTSKKDPTIFCLFLKSKQKI